MRIVRNEEGDGTAREAAEVMRQGGVVLMPTDTLYALCADALSDEAVDRVYAIKGRDGRKPMHALVADAAVAARYGEMAPEGDALLAKHPGLVSLVIPQKPGIGKTGILRDMDTFGFRIPQHALCGEILAAFGGPITATSANLSGREVPQSLGAILAQLGPAVSLIDLAIDGGTLPPAKPSTVVALEGGKTRILREGAVPAGAI